MSIEGNRLIRLCTGITGEPLWMPIDEAPARWRESISKSDDAPVLQILHWTSGFNEP